MQTLLLFLFLSFAPALQEGRICPVQEVERESRVLPAQHGDNWYPLDTTQPTHYEISSTLEEQEALKEELRSAYRQLEGVPSLNQLRVESALNQLPIVSILLGAYLLALLFFRFPGPLWVAFSLHTLLLALRIYVLQRPPVANMVETLLYVPWVTVGAGLLLRGRVIATVGAIALLALLQASEMELGFTTVQPVLNSQLWLSIHVLMVVGSYGIFLLAALLAHLYLLTGGAALAKRILPAMWLGVALLIGGTLLGGVWAAQSWGRFWDWDPKESWAFISICLYLCWIHAYQFRLIREIGLALGASVGFLAITFTWYGVNYLLGTGLHSYGFGSGGTGFYLLGMGADALFLTGASYRLLRKLKSERKAMRKLKPTGKPSPTSP